MTDRRDYAIAALAAAFLFCLGLLVGQSGGVLPQAQAQGGFQPEDSFGNPFPGSGQPPGGVQVNPNRSIRPGFESRTNAPTASDSNSNNRFVAITQPIGSGESVLYVLDAKTEHLLVYRYRRNDKGLEFLAGRKIDYDLKINEWQDKSEFSREEMKRLYAKQVAQSAADAVKRQKDR